ncbi:MAG: 3-phosphoshikimate 1-carboxyvinyltransferase [Planctomycetota bacterium]
MHPRTPQFIPSDARSAVVGQVTDSFGGTIALPGSKSLTNRALLIAGLADGPTRLSNLLECDDSLYLIDALRQLGVEVDQQGSEVLVHGAGGAFPVKTGEFYLGNAGTATRFLTAALAASGGTYIVDGEPRMRERPIKDLLTALRVLGADVGSPTGCPPVTIRPSRLTPGRVNMSGAVSSQFISGVLMAAPLARGNVSVRIEGELVSRPYLDLTFDCMRSFGAKVFTYDKTADGQPIFEVQSEHKYVGREYFVEGDASAASYFFAAAAVTGATIRVEGVGRESSQGDLGCADVLAEMGCRVTKEENAVQVVGGDFLTSVDVDCSEMPDVVPTLAVTALFARGRTRLRGVPHLRHKESDRIASVASELRKIGGQVRELKDGLEIEGSLGSNTETLHGGEIDTWGDHRIAMALSVAGLVIPDVFLREAGVVSKSFPSFFQAMASLGAPVSFVKADGSLERVEPSESPS